MWIFTWNYSILFSTSIRDLIDSTCRIDRYKTVRERNGWKFQTFCSALYSIGKTSIFRVVDARRFEWILIDSRVRRCLNNVRPGRRDCQWYFVILPVPRVSSLLSLINMHLCTHPNYTLCSYASSGMMCLSFYDVLMDSTCSSIHPICSLMRFEFAILLFVFRLVLNLKLMFCLSKIWHVNEFERAKLHSTHPIFMALKLKFHRSSSTCQVKRDRITHHI